MAHRAAKGGGAVIYLELFLSFLLTGLFTVGGGYAALPLIYESCVVRHGWISAAEYAQLISISEITPGPIAINAATFVGTRVGGVLGAIAATLGFALPPFVIITLLYALYRRCRSMSLMQGVLGALRPAVTGLIAAAGLTVLALALWGEGGFVSAVPDLLALALFAVGLFVLRRWKTGPIAVILGCGAVGLIAEVLKLAH